MPEMDGYTATTQIRKNPAHKNLPIVVETGPMGAANVTPKISFSMIMINTAS